MAGLKLKTTAELEQVLNKIIGRIPKVCEICGSRANLAHVNIPMLVCTWSKCKARKVLFNNTIFESLKVDKLVILSILDCWMANCPVMLIPFFINCSTSTVYRVLKLLSSVLPEKYYSGLDKIGGSGIIVEMDESKFGKRKHHRGHRVDGVWVFGGVEKTDKSKIFLKVVRKRNKQLLTELTKKYVQPGSIVHTDCWKGYADVHTIVALHKTVNHSKHFVDPVTKTHTNTIESNWNAVKKTVPGRNRTRRGIGLYLVRFMIIRNEEGDRLSNLLKYLF